MVTCPICGTENEGDFGLITCTSCKSPFFIQIDGAVEAVTPTGAPSAAPAYNEAPSAFAAQENHDVAEDISDSILNDFSQENRESDFSSATNAKPPPLGESMQDIADFGNAEDSVAREGAYRFDITVMGIDSAEIKTEVQDALTDGRFLWDIGSLLNEMQDGILVIKDLSAVKSALVVQRLKILPVDIKWEQHAVHQSV